jgi:predicted transcriptional regulator
MEKETQTELQKPLKSIEEKNIDQVYAYLLRHGARTPLQLVKALRLDRVSVMNALKELERQDKIQLEKPLLLVPTPARVVPPRVPERIKRKAEEKLEKTLGMLSKVHEKQEEIKRKRKQLLTEKAQLIR